MDLNILRTVGIISSSSTLKLLAIEHCDDMCQSLLGNNTTAISDGQSPENVCCQHYSVMLEK
jgi:hypothetical protein